MAITNKALLQQALCDGAFSGVQQGQGPNGQPILQRGAITPAVLQAVAAMPDAEVLATLTLYVASKVATLNAQVAKATAANTTIATQVAALQAQVIA